MYAKKQSWEGWEREEESGGVGEGGEGGKGCPGGWRSGRLIARRSMSCLALSFCLHLPSLAFPCPREVGSHSANSHLFLPSSMFDRYCHSQVPSSVRSRIRELSSTGYCWYLAGSSLLLSCAALLGWSPRRNLAHWNFAIGQTRPRCCAVGLSPEQ